MSLPELYSNEKLIIEASRAGIPKKMFQMIRKSTGLSALTFATATHVTSRTIERKKEQEKISPAASERAILIGKLYFTGENIFGNRQKFILWMGRPHQSLEGKKPEEMLDTLTGIDLVSNILLRIQHGMVA